MNINQESQIEINPNICHGKPVVRGTRVMVSSVLGALAAGDTVEMILEDYPTLNPQDMNSIFEFASRLSAYQSSVYDSVV